MSFSFEDAQRLVNQSRKGKSAERLEAVTALGQFDDFTNLVVPALLHVLKWDNEEVKLKALDALGNLDVSKLDKLPSWREALMSILSSPRNARSQKIKIYALFAMARLKQGRELSPLIQQLLNEEDPKFEFMVLRALGCLREQGALLVPAILDTLPRARKLPGGNDLLAQTLVNMGPRAVTELVPFLQGQSSSHPPSWLIMTNAREKAVAWKRLWSICDNINFRAPETCDDIKKSIDDILMAPDLNEFLESFIYTMNNRTKLTYQEKNNVFISWINSGDVLNSLVNLINCDFPEFENWAINILARMGNFKLTEFVRGLEQRNANLDARLDRAFVLAREMEFRAVVGHISADAIPKIALGLSDGNTDVRILAIRLLSEVDRSASELIIPQLILGLSDKEAKVRRWAILYLGSFDILASQAIPVLINLAAFSDSKTRVMIIKTLILIDSKSQNVIGHILTSLRDDDTLVRTLSLKFILDHRFPLVAPPISGLVSIAIDEKETFDNRVTAGVLLDRFDMAASVNSLVPELIVRLQSENAEMRLCAIEVMSSLGVYCEGAVPLVVGLLANKFERPTLRCEAARALSRLKCSSSVPIIIRALIDVLSENEGMVRTRLGDSPEKSEVGSDSEVIGLPRSIVDLDDVGKFRITAQAMKSLASFGVSAIDAIEPISLILSDCSQPLQIRRIAARVLGTWGKHASTAIPALEKAMVEVDFELFSFASTSLGRIGNQASSAIPHLRSVVMNDENEFRRESAIDALGEFGPLAVDAVDDLVFALQDEKRQCRASAAKALGRIGRMAAVAIPVLREQLCCESGPVKDAIQEALRLLDPTIPA